MRYLVILLLIASSSINASSEQNCNDITVGLDELGTGKVVMIPFQGEDVLIYKRSKAQMQYAKNRDKSKYDTKYPTWWPQNKLPTSPTISQIKTRSINESYFVTWNHDPVYGYYLYFIPKDFTPENNDESSLSSKQIEFLGQNWPGGFVDLDNRIGYDFTGRPVVIDTPQERVIKVGDLPNLNLLIPKYSYEKTSNSITLLCN